MLNGTVEPLLTMTSSTNRLLSMMKSNGGSDANTNDTSSKRSAMKSAALTGMTSSMNSTNTGSSSQINDNRIKFIDMLVCGSCQQDFQLSDIVKFIEHKGMCGNKENKRQIPYFLSQQRQTEGDHDEDDDNDDDGDDDEEDDDENKSQLGSNSSTAHRAHRPQLAQKQSTFSKVLIDANANTSNNAGKLIVTRCFNTIPSSCLR